MAWLGLSSHLRALLHGTFNCAQTLQAAIDDLPDAVAIIKELAGDAVTADDQQVWSEELLEWTLINRQNFKRRRVQKFLELGTVMPLHATATRSSADAYSATVAADITLARKVHKSRLSCSLALATSEKQRADLEDAERVRWSLLFAAWVQEARLPVCAEIEATTCPEESWKRFCGSRRAKTLRVRAHAWKPVREWLVTSCGHSFPRKISDLIDYLDELLQRDKPVPRTLPDSIAAAFSVLETVGCVADEDRLSEKPLWRATLDSVRTLLQTGAKPRQQAEVTPVIVIVALERFVCHEANPMHERALAWVYLLMHWAVLRTDDCVGIDPHRLTLSAECLRGVLVRTKTTGPGKRTGEVAFHVSRKAVLSGCDWIEAGHLIWTSSSYQFARDYFMPCGNRDFTEPVKKMLVPGMVIAIVRRVLSKLVFLKQTAEYVQWEENEVDGLLVDDTLIGFFQGHGPRHWLPSVASAMGWSKEARDFLGRWGLDGHQSNEYVLSSRQTVLEIQTGVAEAICKGNKPYNELELLERMRKFSSDRGGPIDAADRLTCLTQTSAGWCLDVNFPTTAPLDCPSGVPQNLAENTAGWVSPVTPEAKQKSSKEAPYWVSISKRAGFRRLHLKDGCGVFRFNCANSADVWTVNEECAHALCKDCAKLMAKGSNAQAVDSSSSGSSSSSEE